MTWITLPQNNVLAGQAGHLTDHDDIYAALALLWGSTQQATFNVQAPPYNATGNGITDDTVAIQNAINACAASPGGGGVVYFPAGTYLVTPAGSPAVGLTVPSQVVLAGAGTSITTVKKNGAGVLISMSGTTSPVTGSTHVRFSGMQHLGLNGNNLTGALLQLYYADQLLFYDIFLNNNKDIMVDMVEFWDSRFYYAVSTNGGGGVGTDTPMFYLRNASAASGVGASTGNVNNIYFNGCRWEIFSNGAVAVMQGVGVGNPSNIYFTDSKMETASIQSANPHLHVDTFCMNIEVNHLYCMSNGFGAGYSTAADVIVWGTQAGSLENVTITNVTPATIANGVTVFSPVASSNASLRNITGIYATTAPTGAHINFSTLVGSVIVSNCNSNNGTQFAGTIPNGQDPSGVVQTFTASGTWSKPPGAVMVCAQLVGSGGGGGSGAVEASGTVSGGGAGGGGGGYTMAFFPAALLNSTETVTVGTATTGGTAVGTTASNGNPGGAGSGTTFKSVNFATATGGGGGAGGTTTGATGGFAGNGDFFGGSGASSSATGLVGSTGSSTNQAAAGGGSGGGVTTGAAASAGGAGGAVASSGGNGAGTAGTTAGGAGGAGTGTTANWPIPGASGGGGGSATAGNGGVGGAGGIYGAGGGGGGASLTGHSSGAGGAGAAGIAVIVTTCAV